MERFDLINARRRFTGEMFNLGKLELDSMKAHLNELKNGTLGRQEVDNCYALLFIAIIDQSTVVTYEDQNEFQNENENEDEENENEDENINEDEDRDKDPQYCLFMENLTENDKSYKLKLSQNDEEPRFLYYEETGDLDWCDDLQTCTDDSGDEVTVSEDIQMNQKPKRRLNVKKRKVSAKKVVSRRKKLYNHKPRPPTLPGVDDQYQVYLNSYIRPKHGAVTHEDEPVEYGNNATTLDSDSDVAICGMQMNRKPKRRLNEHTKDVSAKKDVTRRKKLNNHESTTHTHQCNSNDPPYQWFLNNIPSVYREANREELVEDEENATTSDSDSDILILDNAQNCSDVNVKQEKLREKLMHILKQPYSEKEHEELSGYIEEEKPICRLLPLRGRSISSAVGAVKKSVLDYGPGSFRWMYNAAHNDPPKALNLLRMFRFWLEHAPDEDIFEPWKDKHILEVQPSEKSALNPFGAAFA